MEKTYGKQKVSVYLAGDSTVADCPPHEAPMAGWGQLFPLCFTREIKVVNLAEGGASSNSFIEEGRLEAVAARLREGIICLFSSAIMIKNRTEQTPIPHIRPI